MVQLSDELIAALDRRAARDGVSRSELVRRAIEATYRDDVDDAIDRAIVEGYTRFPQHPDGLDAEDGGFDDWDEDDEKEHPW